MKALKLVNKLDSGSSAGIVTDEYSIDQSLAEFPQEKKTYFIEDRPVFFRKSSARDKAVAAVAHGEEDILIDFEEDEETTTPIDIEPVLKEVFGADACIDFSSEAEHEEEQTRKL